MCSESGGKSGDAGPGPGPSLCSEDGSDSDDTGHGHSAVLTSTGPYWFHLLQVLEDPTPRRAAHLILRSFLRVKIPGSSDSSRCRHDLTGTPSGPT
jgi:hypothetical protein